MVKEPPQTPQKRTLADDFLDGGTNGHRYRDAEGNVYSIICPLTSQGLPTSQVILHRAATNRYEDNLAVHLKDEQVE
jgi:hypothetical protein